MHPLDSNCMHSCLWHLYSDDDGRCCSSPDDCLRLWNCHVSVGRFAARPSYWSDGRDAGVVVVGLVVEVAAGKHAEHIGDTDVSVVGGADRRLHIGRR